jgi:hypothetical protein
MNARHLLLGLLFVSLPVGCRTESPRESSPPPPTVRETGGNAWFPVTVKDLGTFRGGSEATAVFPFRNPTAGEVQWRQLAPSCNCAKVVVRVGDRSYRLSADKPPVLQRITRVPGQPERFEVVDRIPIAAGAAGEVELHLDMTGVTGGKRAHVDIHSDDPQHAQQRVEIQALGAQRFVLSPAEIQLNKMAWGDRREFSTTVTSPLHADWNIVRMDDAGKAFDVRWTKSEVGGAASWTIHGSYGPVDGDATGGGLLKFHTDLDGGAATFSLRVVALVQGPVAVEPGGFLPLGLVRKGKGVTKEVVFAPTDGFDLQVTSLSFEKLSVPAELVTASWRKAGAGLVVELQVAEAAPAGMLKGELVVGLNHPQASSHRVVWNGFVR